MTGKPGRNPPPKDFESALSELESLIAGLEAGQLTLEQSLNAYRRGVELLAYCQRVLGEAEQQVKILEAGELKDLNAGVETDNDAGN
ncbi:MAG: exodeoxyribonuclease VII small subunit [Thiobacillaceae bacterium]